MLQDTYALLAFTDAALCHCNRADTYSVVVLIILTPPSDIIYFKAMSDSMYTFPQHPHGSQHGRRCITQPARCCRPQHCCSLARSQPSTKCQVLPNRIALLGSVEVGGGHKFTSSIQRICKRVHVCLIRLTPAVESRMANLHETMSN